MISTGERYSSTVAVPALDRPMVVKYISWHMAMPSEPKASTCSAVRGFFHMRVMTDTDRPRSALKESSKRPAISIRTLTSHPALTLRCCIRN